MSVIIRLQGLSWSASTVDIRGMFVGLSIPQGGVHIIGGTQGLAFIAFASDDDARQAMMRNGATLCGSLVQLFLSSKSEMQAVITEARGADPPSRTSVPSPAAAPFTPRGQQGGGMQTGDAAGVEMRQGGPQGLKAPDRFPPDRDMPTRSGPRKPLPTEGQSYPSPAVPYGQGPLPNRGLQHQAHSPLNEGAEDQVGRQGGGMSRFGDKPPRQGPGQFTNELPEHDTQGSGHHGSFSQTGPQNFGNQQEQFASRGSMPGGQEKNRGGLLPMPENLFHGDLGSMNQQRNMPGLNFDNTKGAGVYPEREEEVLMRGTAWQEYQGGRGHPPVHAPSRQGPEDDMRAAGQGPPQDSERGWSNGRGGIQSYRAPASDIDKRQGRGRHGDEEDLDFRSAAQSRKRPWPTDEGIQEHDLQAADGNQDWRPVRRRYEDRPMEATIENRARDRSLDQEGAMDSRSNRPQAGNARMSGIARYGENDFDSSAGRDTGHSESPYDDRSTFRGPGGRPPFPGKERNRMAEREYNSWRVNDRDRERTMAGRDFNTRYPHGASTNSGPDCRSLDRDVDGRSRRVSPGNMPLNRDHDKRERNTRDSFDRGSEGRRKEMWHDRYQQGSADGQKFEEPFEDTEPGKRFDGPRHSRFRPQEDEEFRDLHGFQFSDRGRFEGRGRGRGRGQRGERGFRGERRGGSWKRTHEDATHEHGKGFPPSDHPEGDAYLRSDETGLADQEFEGEGLFRGQWSDRRDHDDGRGRGHGRKGMERGRNDWGRGGRRGRGQGGFMDNGEVDSRNADDRFPRYSHPAEGNDEWKHLPDAPQQSRPVKKGLLGDAPPGVHRNRPHLNESTEPPRNMENDLLTETDFSHPRGRGRGRGAFSDRYGEQDRGRERSSVVDRTHGPNRWDRDRSREKDPNQPNTSKYKWHAQSQTNKADTEKTTGNIDKSDAQITDSSSFESSFVQVKGVPMSYGATEIRNLFFGCEIEGDSINILKNVQGQPTGEVNIKFVNEENAKRAVGKSGEKVVGKPVTVTFITGETFEREPESHTTSSSRDEKKNVTSDDLIIMIKGFPPNIKLEDVRNLFASVKLAEKETAALIERDNQQKATGVAYLEVASQQDFDKALGFNGQVFGEGTLQITTGQRQDVDACIKRQEGMFQNSTITVVEKLSAQAAQPSGLGLGVMGARPPLMGQAPSKSLPQPLLSLSFPQPKPDPALDSRNSPGNQASDLPHSERPPDFCVHLKDLPAHVSYFEIRDFFSGLNIVYNRGVQIVHDGGGNRTGEAFVQFTSQQDKEQALKMDGRSMGRHILAVVPVSKSEMISCLKDARMVGQVPFDDDIGPVKTFRPGLLNPEWCYLSCTNFPRTFAEPDFLNFFADFGPIPESVRLHRSPEGVPTGKALVGFPHREDAIAALRELHGMQVGPFTVALQAAM